MSRNHLSNHLDNKRGFCILEGYKHCKRCDQVLDLSDFSKNKYICKSCTAHYKRILNFSKKGINLLPEKNITRKNTKIILEEKRCKGICKRILPISEFSKCTHTNIGKSRCKNCLADESKIYFQKNKRERIAKASLKRKNNPYYRNIQSIRQSVRRFAIEMNGKPKTLDLIGCTWDYLKTYLQSQFKPEMTWENYGTIWHLDHKIPICLFDLCLIECQKIGANFRNLQPSLKQTNYQKSDFLPNGMRARYLPKIKSKQELLDLIQTWPRPEEFEWVRDIEIPL